MSYNFLTPAGLKVRLNHNVLMSLVAGDFKQYDIDEIFANPKTNSILVWIEAMYELKSCFVWYWIIAYVFLFERISTTLFFGVSFVLFLCGFLIAYIMPGIITFLTFQLYSIYHFCRNIFIRSGIIIALSLIFRHPVVILYAVISFVAMFIIESIINHLLLVHTKKKYGYAYGDTEIFAFNVAYRFADETKLKELSIHNAKDLIAWYTELFRNGFELE